MRTTTTPEAPVPDGDRWAGVRWWFRALIEIAVLYAVVVAAEVLLFGGRVGSYRVHPHPYWLIVIPMASARGMAAGLASAVVAAGLYLVGAMHARPDASLDEILSLTNMMEPVLFFGVGYLVGEFRDLVAKRIRDLEHELGRTRTWGDGLRQQRDVLTEANRVLERRMVDHATQFGNLVTAAQRVETAGRAELLEITLELIEEHCGAASSILVPLTDGSIDYVTHRGWPKSDLSKRLDAARASPFVHRSLAEGIEVDGFALDQEVLPVGPLAVCPLVGAAGIIEGLLCLDEVVASRLNTKTVRTFFAIGRWISSMLTRLPTRAGDLPPPTPSESREEPRHPYDPAPDWLGTPLELGRDLQSEFDRTRRYGLPLSMLTIQLVDLTDRDDETLATADRYLQEILTSDVRATDAFYRFSQAGCYVMMLPGTPVTGGETLRERLRNRLSKQTSPFGGIAIHVTGPDPDAPDPESLLDRIVARFREEGSLPLSGDRPEILPPRPSVGSLADCVRKLHDEVCLATRHGFELQVLDLKTGRADDVDAGLLALHIDRVLDVTLRRSDSAFAIGPGHVAVVLSHTGPEEAHQIERRIDGVLTARDPEPIYGSRTCQVLTLGEAYENHRALLRALHKSRGLSEVTLGREAS